MRQANQW